MYGSEYDDAEFGFVGSILQQLYLEISVSFPKVHGPPLIAIATPAHAWSPQIKKIPGESCVCVVKLRVTTHSIMGCG